MDPASLIEIALASGASAGLKATASSAVTDAYEGLKAKVKSLFAGHQRAQLVLAEHEVSPETWKAPLISELSAAGVEDDLVAAAQTLMRLIDAASSRGRKYVVDVQNSHNVQIGDGNTQHNTYMPAPVPPPPGAGSHGNGVDASASPFGRGV